MARLRGSKDSEILSIVETLKIVVKMPDDKIRKGLSAVIKFLTTKNK